ncbi:polypeptide N-acetylgalactosaminyltransferase 5-like [Babylonia areolata]|uniref:polypeptide N-acetylgalactosaminyltransferase 5-like n=1 Tax=Babylonia areolata TaxID=304850 RepID=UPI003FD19916
MTLLGRLEQSLFSGTARETVEGQVHNDAAVVVAAADTAVSDKQGNNNGSARVLQETWNDPQSPGYGGRGVEVDKAGLDRAQRQRYEEGYRRFHANVFVSDLIPLRRTIHDALEPECRAKRYFVESLPRAGVVVVFHNEAWSILLRTVHSVLGASPPALLTELVLVDDASDMEHLGRPLEDYVSLLDRVKLVRLANRSGLMAARMAGFHHVTGHVAAFLDSHCEVPEGWLEPLLARISENQQVVAVPVTDHIDLHTFRYHPSRGPNTARGGFDLDLYFMWIHPQSGARRSGFEPIRSPTHLGCCFAVAKSTFQRLGLYDPGLKIWGCENMELSFKTWMCGGRVEIIPCSHVGHMFRYTAPYSWGPDGDVLTKNCLRVAEVWMDEYKLFYHDRIFYRQVEFGDVAERKALRRSLGCRSFRWYLDTVYPDLYLPVHSKATGQIQNGAAVPSRCVETAVHYKNNTPVSAKPCNTAVLIQHFTLTKEDQIRRDEGCLDVDVGVEGRMVVVVRPCQDLAHSQGWRYLELGERVTRWCTCRAGDV